MPVTLSEVGHQFPGGQWLFRKLDAHVHAGEVCAVVGPSGSGKSTLLSIIAGWLTPTEGTVDCAKGSIAWVLQNPHGSAHRTALDHVALPLLAQGLNLKEAEQEALQLLDDFGIAGVADRPFATLSGGEAQRLLLARAIARAPEVLLVDEPTAQLDQKTARQVAASLTALRARGIAVMIATHDHFVRDQCATVIDLGDYPDDTPSRIDPVHADAATGGGGR